MHLVYGGQQIQVAPGDFIIGAGPGLDFRLAGPSVLPRHAVLRRTGGTLVIAPAVATASVWVNGTPIGNGPTPLRHGDRIGIGDHEMIVTDPGARVRAAGRLVNLTDGREYPITVVPFGLGRDAGSEVVIASPDASRRHAEIVSRPDGDVLVDLSNNGTYVNGSRIDGRRPLKALDVIRIGAEEFRYDGPAVPPVGAAARLSDTLIGLPARRPLATLRIKSGDAKGVRHQVTSPVVNLGRAESNEIRFSDASVSASHAKLQLREGVWTLTDLGSATGSVVDDEPVTEETPLSPGATIRLGDVAISFEPNDDRVAVQRPIASPPAAPAARSVLVAEPVVAPKPARSRIAVGLLVAAIVLLAAALTAVLLFL